MIYYYAFGWTVKYHMLLYSAASFLLNPIVEIVTEVLAIFIFFTSNPIIVQLRYSYTIYRTVTLTFMDPHLALYISDSHSFIPQTSESPAPLELTSFVIKLTFYLQPQTYAAIDRYRHFFSQCFTSNELLKSPP